MPETTQYVVARPEALEPFARDIFVALGTPHVNAAEVARHLVHSNLAGHD
ncbi:MAG: Ldh family oxidoreductase, partial [Proteobacteria bacterium]|nr:Ldh family oxidoreductase [Pseudomonadota bacterium]